MWRRGPGLTVVMMVALAMLAAGCGDDDAGTQPQNSNPVIAALTVDFPVVQPGNVCALACTASDPDDDALTYHWECAEGAITADGAAASWTAPATGGTCTLTVTVTDARDGSAARSVTVEVVAATLLVQTKDGLVAADFTGGGFLLNDLNTKVEVLGTRIFQMGYPRVYEIDHQGETINTVPCADPEVEGHNFFMLPDAGFAFVTNWSDSVFFMDASGALEFKGPLPEISENSLQCVYGRVVGNRLILSETGTDKLAAFDLDTFEGSIFREFPGRGWLGALAYDDGMFYLAGCTLIRKFTETGEPADLCNVEQGCWTGLAWAGGYLWGVINFEGKLYRIDPVTGDVVTILEGLDYPQDLEFLPVVLEEPAGP